MTSWLKHLCDYVCVCSCKEKKAEINTHTTYTHTHTTHTHNTHTHTHTHTHKHVPATEAVLLPQTGLEVPPHVPCRVRPSGQEAATVHAAHCVCCELVQAATMYWPAAQLAQGVQVRSAVELQLPVRMLTPSGQLVLQATHCGLLLPPHAPLRNEPLAHDAAVVQALQTRSLVGVLGDDTYLPLPQVDSGRHWRSVVAVHVAFSYCVVAVQLEQAAHWRSDVMVHVPVRYWPAGHELLHGVQTGLLRSVQLPTRKLPAAHDAAWVHGVHSVLAVAVQLAAMYEPAAQLVAQLLQLRLEVGVGALVSYSVAVHVRGVRHWRSVEAVHGTLSYCAVLLQVLQVAHGVSVAGW